MMIGVAVPLCVMDPVAVAVAPGRIVAVTFKVFAPGVSDTLGTTNLPPAVNPATPLTVIPVFTGPLKVPVTSTEASLVVPDVETVTVRPPPMISVANPGEAEPPGNCVTEVNVGDSKPL